MKDEKKYRESKIEEILWSMSSDFHELAFMWEFTPDENKNEYEYLYKEEDIKSSFKQKSKTVYKIIIAYFEDLKLDAYLTGFKAEIDEIILKEKNLFEALINNDDGEQYSATVNKLWNYLAPFEFSQQSYIDKLLKSNSTTYLERILRNTQVIINKTNSTPNSETQVYNTVKYVVHSVFPSSLNPTSGFFKSFKNYNPDILIPEIHVAIEYKYADSETKLKAQIDQVVADTKGYTGDTNYELFYAVFYVTDDFWGIDKFENVWKEMEFPKNWKGIYVIGKK